MVNESTFEKEFVLKKFTDDLGYNLISNNLFNDKTMLYQDGLKQFIENTQEELVNKIIKLEYCGDSQLFWEDFFQKVSDKLYYKHNVAIKMNRNIKISINDNKYDFFIYENFDSFSKNRNNYSVMSQLPVNRRKDPNNINIIPDIGVFVNGVLICYMELKFNNTGQSAKISGRQKIISDYSKCIGEYVLPSINNKLLTEKEKNEIKTKKLKIFHAPIFLISLDNHSAYVYRNIRDLYSNVAADYRHQKTGISKETMHEGLKNFMLDCIFEKKDGNYITDKAKMDRFFKNTFSKDAIQNEITILNTLKYSKDSKGENLDNSAILFTPRPNQKFSLDIINERIKEFYDHESELFYFENKEINELENRGFPKWKIQEIIEKQRKFKNNNSVFSLLLQYSTGFGKTAIACNSAISLKNMKDLNGHYLFDKILIVSDRIDLREQIGFEMRGMNIQKSLFGTPRDKKELHNVMKKNSVRIVIINIQKFRSFNKLINSSDRQLKKSLKNKRVAFIIDEIHRSHTGVQHETMTDLFSDLSDDFFNFSNQLNNKKKNLIIALTATPTEENLARFGELDSYQGGNLWKPFDSYTMQSAIKDGFVLDPTQSMLFYMTAYHFEEKENVRIPSKKEIYENKDRISECSKIIVKTLIETTYNQISKQGKGMLCCSSISSANSYYDEIKKQIGTYLTDKGCSEDEIENVKDMILMVYTNSQSTGTHAYKRCGLNSEEEVINKFKDGKNGLMIVVDKLQTGFNEPKLHTLFLDKEVSGINCVQTLSRVNRVMTGKKDCLIVDFSYNNENAKNIQNAFTQYSNTVSSSIEPFSIEERIEENYKEIIKSEYYKFYYQDGYKNIDRSIQKSEYVKFNIINNEQKISYLYKAMSNFRKDVELIKNIINLKSEYTNKMLLNFINEFMRLVYVYTKDEEIDYNFTDIIIEGSGFIIDETISTCDTYQDTDLNKNKNKSTTTGESSLDEIIARNKNEELKLIHIEKYKKMLYSFFDLLNQKDNEKIAGSFYKTLNEDGKISDDEYKMIYNSAKRQFRKIDDDSEKFIKMIDGVYEFVKYDYVAYLRKK